MNDTLKQTLDQHRLSQLSRFSPQQIELLMEHCDLGTDALAFALLTLAQDKAQAPISELKVGALAIGGSGFWYFGANVEFTSLPISQTLHAEQAAVGHAALWDEQYLAGLYVSHSPCGHCRQFLHELNQGSLLVAWPEGHLLLNELLPQPFGPQELGHSHGMLTFSEPNLAFAGETPSDALTLSAWHQANASYAPYSHNRAGVALLLKDGQICHGRNLENAAFNPSLAPLQLALSQLYLQGYTPADISRAVLVEAKAPSQQTAIARTLLSTLCDVTLESFIVV